MSAHPEGHSADCVVPFEARLAMQKALWAECIQPADNEWTTWSDAIILAETAADALEAAGYEVRLIEERTDGS